MFVLAAAAFVIAQSGKGLAQLTAVEQVLADKIKCDEWKKNPNGSWTSSLETPRLLRGLGRWMEPTWVPF
jgi:hypothetical protein